MVSFQCGEATWEILKGTRESRQHLSLTCISSKHRFASIRFVPLFSALECKKVSGHVSPLLARAKSWSPRLLFSNHKPNLLSFAAPHPLLLHQLTLPHLSYLSLTPMFGKLFHYAADAILISAVLAGIKRSTVCSPSVQLSPAFFSFDTC